MWHHGLLHQIALAWLLEGLDSPLAGGKLRVSHMRLSLGSSRHEMHGILLSGLLRVISSSLASKLRTLIVLKHQLVCDSWRLVLVRIRGLLELSHLGVWQCGCHARHVKSASAREMTHAKGLSRVLFELHVNQLCCLWWT